jgi:uncharacterized protein (TIGR03067 family)
MGIAALARDARAQDAAAVKQEVARMQGEWAMAAGGGEGERVPGAMLRTYKRVAKGDTTTVTVMGMVYMKAIFAVDPLKTPRAIDYRVIGGETVGKRQLGIYEFAGDTLKFCFAQPGGERPADFSGRAGTGHTCSAWLRAKE